MHTKTIPTIESIQVVDSTTRIDGNIVDFGNCTKCSLHWVMEEIEGKVGKSIVR